MRFNGQYRYKVGSQRVFSALLNPTVLRSCIPGCSSVKYLDADHISIQITTQIPGLRGPYRVVIQISKREEPNLLVLEIHRKVTGGSMDGVIRTTFTDGGGGSLLAYSVNGNVTGPLSFIANTLGEGMVMNSLSGFFRNLDRAVS